MTHFKNILTGLAILGTCTLTATPTLAQEKKQTQTNNRTTAFERNSSLIKAFSQTDNLQKSFDILSKIKNNLREELAHTKREVALAHQNGDETKAKTKLAFNQKLGSIYNQIVLASRSVDKLDKTAAQKTLAAYKDMH